jgi:L-amino acid N-acyltransferase YncA
MHIRRFSEEDWPQVWPIFRDIVRAGDTYTFDPEMTEADARRIWIQSPPGLTVVATDDSGRILGTAKMTPNQAGPGRHIANASFMVSSLARGQGVGRAFCEFSLHWAREQGFAGMQFNAVAETNVHAIRLYEQLGFTIIGTVPGGFDHPEKGRVGLHIMFCPLD